MYEVRIHSRGGQGGTTAARLVADAAFRDGKFAMASPFYGAERRGAPIASYIRINDQPIRVYSYIHNPDLVIVLDTSIMGAVNTLKGLKEGGLVILNSSQPKEIANVKTYYVDLTGIALGQKLIIAGNPVLNTPLLGAIARIGIISLNSAIAAIRGMFSDERNVTAAEAAYRELVL